MLESLFNKVSGLQARSYSSAVAGKPNKGGIAFKLMKDFIIRPFWSSFTKGGMQVKTIPNLDDQRRIKYVNKNSARNHVSRGAFRRQWSFLRK